jgi:UrcA family protein
MIKLLTKTMTALAISATACASAHAQTVAVKVSDLNLSDAAQMQMLGARIDSAARRFCATAPLTDLNQAAACREGVRVEVMDKVGSSASAAAKGRISVATR